MRTIRIGLGWLVAAPIVGALAVLLALIWAASRFARLGECVC